MQALNLDIEPVWEEIDRVRERVVDFLRRADVDADTTSALSMVVCELMENATKYGAFTSDAPGISVEVAVKAEEIVVEVQNPVSKADELHLARLDKTVQWIRGYQDPFEVYLERLREVSGQSLHSSESGLGLVRIAYEGQSVLDFYVNERNVLAVSAIHRRAVERRRA